MMKKALSFGIICIGVSSLCLAQDSSSKFSYSTPASSVNKVLADISKITKIDLKGSPQTANDIVVIRWEDIQLSEAMTKLAETVGAEWQKTSTGYILVRTLTMVQKHQRLDIDKTAAEMRSNLNIALAELKKNPNFDQKTAQELIEEGKRGLGNIESAVQGRRDARNTVRNLLSMSARSPGGRAILRLLERMNIAELAALPHGGRVVYATTPVTRVQRSLPYGSESVLNQWLGEERAFAQAAKGGAGKVEVMGFSIDLADQNRVRLLESAIPAKAHLVATRDGFIEGVNLTLTVADAQGRTLATGFLPLNLLSEGTEKPAVPAKQGTPITFSSLTQEFLKTVSASGQNQSTRPFTSSSGQEVTFLARTEGPGTLAPKAGLLTKLSSELRERVISPDRFEPLAMAPSEALLGLAEHKKKNLIAYLPDNTLQLSLALFGKPGVTLEQFEQELSSTWKMDVQVSDGWLFVKPTSYAQTWANRVDRSALGQALRLVAENGRLSLDELAAYALSQPEEFNFRQSFDSLYFQIVNSGVGTRIGGMLSWQRDMLRFYGTLGFAQKQTLAQGGKIKLSTLSAFQNNLLGRMVWYSFDGPRTTGGRREQQPSRQGQQRAQVEERQTVGFGGYGAMFGSARDIRNERTEILPNGILGQAEFSMSVNKQQAALGVDQNGEMGDALTPQAMAMRQSLRSNSNFGGLMAMMPNYSKFRMATQVDYSFHFSFAPSVSLSRSLTDVVIDKNAPILTYNELPEAFRKQVDVLSQQYQQISTRMQENANRRPQENKAP